MGCEMIGGICSLTIDGKRFDVSGSSSFGVEVPASESWKFDNEPIEISGTCDMEMTPHGNRFFWWLNFGIERKKNASTLKSFLKRYKC